MNFIAKIMISCSFPMVSDEIRNSFPIIAENSEIVHMKYFIFITRISKIPAFLMNHAILAFWKRLLNFPF